MEWPSRKDEEWRRTDLRPLRPLLERLRPWEPAASDPMAGLPEPIRRKLDRQPDEAGSHFQRNSEPAAADLAPEWRRQGVIFCCLEEAIRDHRDLVEPRFMTQAVPPETNKFTALHAALTSGGCFLYVPDGVRVEAPFHSVVYADSPGLGIFSHTLIVVGKNAKVVFLEERISPSASAETDGAGRQTLAATVAEIFCDSGSQVQFVTLQNWGDDVFNFTQERLLARDRCTVRWITGEIGSRLTKGKITMDVLGPESDCELLGVYLLDGRQHSDLVTLLDHRAPNTQGNVLFKGACWDRSRTVFRGCIRVGPEAHRTQSFLADHTMLLADTARSDSVPTLEIEARDVMCKHAATVGQPDPEQIFYLLSRGLPRDEAMQLLVFGFFEAVLSKVPVEAVQRRLRAELAAKLAGRRISEEEVLTRTQEKTGRKYVWAAGT